MIETFTIIAAGAALAVSAAIEAHHWITYRRARYRRLKGK